MKKILPKIISIISILIVVIYMITVNFNSNNNIKLENISGDIKELDNVSLEAYRSNGIALVNNFTINKDGIKKDKLISLRENINSIPTYEDKEFYRGKGFGNNNIYENNNIRFAANINQYDYKKIVQISYRDKKSGELIQFDVDVDPSWSFIKAVYSNGDKHNIMIESPEDNQYVIVDVDLTNKTLKIDKILNRNEDVNDKTKYIAQDNLMNRESGRLNNLDKWYFYNKEISKDNNGQRYTDDILSSRKIISLDPINYHKKEYSLEVKKGLTRHDYYTYFYDDYIYDVIDENNKLKIYRINIKNQKEEVYENIPLVDDLRNYKDDKKNNIEFQRGFIKDEKLYCIFRKNNLVDDSIKSVDFYINVIDLNSKKSLYLGKVINAFDIGFSK